MCGIAGWFDLAAEQRPEVLLDHLEAMSRAVAHRGPDGDGTFIDASCGIALAHRRLAILDLSPNGAQPMTSRDGRWVLVFNGAIYNYVELRGELAASGVEFRGTSDTEVLLEAVARWGVEQSLNRANGMFALAAWDQRDRQLTLARDRLGEKPLYWSFQSGVLAFGSELQALTARPSFDLELDREIVAEMLRWSFVPGDRSVIKGIRRLLPGQLLQLRSAEREPTLRPYWSVAGAAAQGRRHPVRGCDAEIIEMTESHLEDAVRLRLRSDVPLGCFLSGGIDSSLVAALAVQHTAALRTFTVAMDGGSGLDESGPAAAVAGHLGTDHTSVLLSAQEVMASIDELGTVYDEPFGDPSGLAVLALARTTRQHVTVAVSGDGGDEVFGGYNRYVATMSILRRTAAAPGAARLAAARLVKAVPVSRWQRAGTLSQRLPFVGAIPEFGSKMHRAADVVASRNLGEAFLRLASIWPEPPVRGVRVGAATAPQSSLEGLMLHDQCTTLPHDMLTKVDRATMSVALEARVPLLDHRLLEWSWRLPASAKFRDGRGKWILRQVLAKHLPPSVLDHPKTGFDPPIGAWLRGPLRGWAEERLSTAALSEFGVIEPAPVQAAWRAHLTGRVDHTYRLWGVLMLQSWLGACRRRVAA